MWCSNSFFLNEQKTDKAGKILILDTMLDADQYLFNTSL